MMKNKAILRWILLLPFMLIFFLVDKLKSLLAPKIGIAENVKIHYNTSIDDGTSFLTVNNLGVQFCTYYIQDHQYFRFSFAKKILNLVIINARFGTNQNNYTFKIILKWL